MHSLGRLKLKSESPARVGKKEEDTIDVGGLKQGKGKGNRPFAKLGNSANLGRSLFLCSL